MKKTAQFLLVNLFITVFTAALLAGTLKFQLLNYSFWTNSFQKHSIYTKISQVFKSSINKQINKGGGDKNDMAILTDLITPENTKDFVNKNLFNLLSFVNGKNNNLMIYVPINKIPKNILPKNVVGINQEMTLQDLGKKLNIVGLEDLPLKSISNFGLYNYYTLIVSTFLTVIFLILMMLLVEAGKRFTAPGVGFVLTGITVLLLAQSGASLNSYINKNFVDSTSLNKIVALSVVPPVVGDLIITWLYVGIGLVVIGILMFFIKKPNKKAQQAPNTPKSVLLPN